MARATGSIVNSVVASLQFRLIAGFALILSAALLSVSLYVSVESTRQAEHSEALRLAVRAERARVFLEHYFADRSGWSLVQPELEQLGRLLGARILVRDVDGRLVGDSHRRFADLLHGERMARRIRLASREGSVIGDFDVLALRRYAADQNPEPVDSELSARVNRALLWAGLAAGALGILAVGLMARRALSPVRSLSAAADRLGRGDLSQRVSPSSGGEIGRLGDSFNRMASDLEEAERQRRALLADVAHELRTPLSNIGGYVEAICDGLVEPSANNLGIIQQQVAQLARLVEDLRLLTQAESGALKLYIQPGNVSELLERVAESFEPRASAKGVHVRCRAVEEIPPVHMDTGRIRQVLYNLVENAMTHTPKGGTITLSADEMEQDFVRVSIEDTGPGMDPADLDTIFGRFHRLDPSRSRATGGAGLGLTIAKQLVEAHRGRIWAESEPGRGSTFTFELPVSQSNLPKPPS